MTTRSAASAGWAYLEVDRNLPSAKLGAHCAYKLLSVACMRLVTNPAGASFSFFDNMNEMQIAIAITEICIDGGFSETEHVFLMTVQACVV